MKSVLLSVNPHWCELIASGKKTLEVRKTRPKQDTPFKCYIYQTKPKSGDRNERDGRVIGEFVCDKIERYGIPYPAYQKELPERFVKESCVRYYDLHRYAWHDDLYFWHISTLKIYDDPRKLSEFSSGSSRLEISDTEDGLYLKRSRMERPPQSWCYVYDEKGAKE